MKKLDFRARIEVDKETGKVIAVYLQVRKGRAARVQELANGSVFVNYDHNNLLLGVELLAPCSLAVFDRVTRVEPAEVKSFLLGNIPREMAIGA